MERSKQVELTFRILGSALVLGTPSTFFYEKLHLQIVEAAPGFSCSTGLQTLLPPGVVIDVNIEDAINRRLITVAEGMSDGREFLFQTESNATEDNKPAFKALVSNKAVPRVKLQTIAPCGRGAIVDFKRVPKALTPTFGAPVSKEKPVPDSGVGAGAGSNSSSNSNIDNRFNITIGSLVAPETQVPAKTPTETPTPTHTPTRTSTPTETPTQTLATTARLFNNGEPVVVTNDLKNWIGYTALALGGALLISLGLAGWGWRRKVVVVTPEEREAKKVYEGKGVARGRERWGGVSFKRRKDKKDITLKEAQKRVEDLEKERERLEREKEDLRKAKMTAEISAENAKEQIKNLLKKGGKK